MASRWPHRHSLSRPPKFKLTHYLLTGAVRAQAVAVLTYRRRENGQGATMRRLILTSVLLFGLAAPPAWADFDAGVAAYDSGDYETAFREFKTLAEQGDAHAQASLGFMYENGRGVVQDYAEAVKWYRKAAEQGVVLGQYNLGVMYAKGQGVPQDYAEAANWYRRAAERNDGVSQSTLGIMYAKGYGVPQDFVRAHMWLGLAASNLPPGYDHDTAVRNREYAARLMTPDQIAEAQRLAREWKPKTE